MLPRHSLQIRWPIRVQPAQTGGNIRSSPLQIPLYKRYDQPEGEYTGSYSPDEAIRIAAGVKSRMNMGGKMKMAIGMIILMGAACAFSSANCRRFIRI